MMQNREHRIMIYQANLGVGYHMQRVSSSVPNAFNASKIICHDRQKASPARFVQNLSSNASKFNHECNQSINSEQRESRIQKAQAPPT